jgi:Tfp pilus assembly protein PilO
MSNATTNSATASSAHASSAHASGQPSAASQPSSSSSALLTSANVRPPAGIANVFAHGWQIDLAGVALCAILSVGAYFAGWQPLENSRAAEEARASALSLAREQVGALSLSSRSVRGQLTKAQTAIAKVDVPLQPVATVNTRMAELTTLAAECGLDVQYTQMGAVTSNNRYAQVPIQLSGAGTYRTCALFLHRLRERFGDTGMKSFEIAAMPSASSNVTSFNFQLVWYVQPTNAR